MAKAEGAKAASGDLDEPQDAVIEDTPSADDGSVEAALQSEAVEAPEEPVEEDEIKGDDGIETVDEAAMHKEDRAASSDTQVEEVEEAAHEQPTFPIVAVGASAGGFEAFREFLQNLPEDVGMAIVLIQHLDPTHESQLAPLLSRATNMPATEARNGERVEPNHLYVIPPHSQMIIRNGVLHLEPRGPVRGQPTTIDRFMRALAEDWGDQAIGVVLSGTLSDGTQGLQEIKAAGGFTFAQDLESARYLEMPRSAIASGHVDFVLPPKGIAEEIYRLGKRLPLTAQKVRDGKDPLEDSSALSQLFSLVRTRTGVDFTHYKRSTLERRIQRRMMAKRANTLEQYVTYVRRNPEEARELYEEILIHVTRFYRDRELFKGLEEIVFPALLRDRSSNEELRIWVAGCATGEEAYSLAIALQEFQNRLGTNVPLQVFATDLSDSAISTARNGLYPESIAADVPENILANYFQKVDGGYQISKSIRSMCVFAVHDLTRDPPFSNMDMVSCRNVLIYMEPANQQRVLAVLHYALRDGGYLVLGTSESPSRMPDLFESASKQQAIYTKSHVKVNPIHSLATSQTVSSKSPDGKKKEIVTAWSAADVEREADKLLLDRHGPAAVVVTATMEVVHFRGETTRYLKHSSGPASLNVMKMLRDGLSVEVHAAIQTVKEKQKPETRRNVRFDSPSGEGNARIDVYPLIGPTQKDRYFLVAFHREEPVASAGASGGFLERIFGGPSPRELEALQTRNRQLEQELTSTRQYMRALVEDYETTMEELRCANEEALSSNEELQSTNEELETAKEEAQSTNEELRTLNEELIHRSMEIQKANNDMMNLLNSVDLPIVMLNRSLIIRRFTPRAQKMLNLIPTDLGRPITDINPPFEGIDLKSEVLGVLESLQVRRVSAKDTDGKDVQIQIHPYRTSDDQIDGTVLVIMEPHRNGTA